MPEGAEGAGDHVAANLVQGARPIDASAVLGGPAWEIVAHFLVLQTIEDLAVGIGLLGFSIRSQMLAFDSLHITP